MESQTTTLGTDPVTKTPAEAGAGGIVRHDSELLPVVDEEAVLDGLADLALYLSETG
jgi:hypothetical protein